jgi:superfamily I DNA/RNA helicase
MQLRWDRRVKVNDDYPVKNFGDSKGQAFQRVVIYPTSPFIKWLKDNKFELPQTSRAKLYVAITRAINSVCIVNDNAIEGIEEFTCL